MKFKEAWPGDVGGRIRETKVGTQYLVLAQQQKAHEKERYYQDSKEIYELMPANKLQLESGVAV